MTTTTVSQLGDVNIHVHPFEKDLLAGLAEGML